MNEEKLNKILALKAKRDEIDSELDKLLNNQSNENVDIIKSNVKYKNIPEGWTVERDEPPTGKTKFDFKPVCKQGSWINSDEMIKKSKELNGYMGMAEAEYLLEHQDLIIKDIRDKYIIFPATILRDSDGFLCIAYLRWYDGRWVVGFCWLGLNFGSVDRVACSE